MRKIMLLAAPAMLLFFASCKNSPDAAGNNNGDGNAQSTESRAPTIAKPKAPHAEGPLRILFVGNSHTEYYVSIPDLFSALCKENGKEIKVDKLIEMGVAIDEILSAQKSKAEKLFALTDKDSNYYDFIILQEKTPVAYQQADKYNANVKSIADMAAKNSPGAAIYVYELMAPMKYSDGAEAFKKDQQLLLDNAQAVAKQLTNAGVYRVGEAIEAAYALKPGEADGKDMLREPGGSLHMLNNGGFLASILLYETLFDTTPKIPAQLPLSTGTGDSDRVELQDVATAIPNAAALEKIAAQFR